MSDSHVIFTVVVPSYQRPERLATCVAAIGRLEYPREAFELIVVDDGSDPPLESAVAGAAPADLNWRCLRQANQGPGAARNVGVAEGAGRYIAFIDDDATPEPGWLSAFERALDASPQALVGGAIRNGLPRARCSTASQQLVSFLYDYFDGSPGRPRFFCSNNIAVSRETFQRLGGFCVTGLGATAEDRELCDRWHHAGLPLVYEPQAGILHSHAMNLRQYWRQHFRYGQGARYFHLVRADRGQPGLAPEPLSFYWRLMTWPFHDPSELNAWGQSALFAVSQVANAAGYAAERFSPRANAPKIDKHAEDETTTSPERAGIEEASH
ncbi:MAG: glycosyltransferase [Planctomycetota bacterium]